MENTAPIVEKIMYDGITMLIKGTICYSSSPWQAEQQPNLNCLGRALL